MSRCLILSTLLMAMSGCTVTKDLTNVLILQPLHFPINIERFRTKHSNRLIARTYLAERLGTNDPTRDWWGLSPYVSAHHGLDVHPDYAKGYVKGFTDYLTYGGAGLPPIAPPRKYWRLRYANPEGQELIQAWYAGFTDGSADAMTTGYREMRLIPTSWDAGEGVLQRDAPPPPADEEIDSYPGFEEVIPSPELEVTPLPLEAAPELEAATFAAEASWTTLGPRAGSTPASPKTFVSNSIGSTARLRRLPRTEGTEAVIASAPEVSQDAPSHELLDRTSEATGETASTVGEAETRTDLNPPSPPTSSRRRRN